MKPIRLTSAAITQALRYRIEMDRLRLRDREIADRIAERQNEIAKLAERLLPLVQAKLDEINGRARARTITSAQSLFDIAIGVEVELRTRGVSIDNMKETNVHYTPRSGFRNITTSVTLERSATGWFVTNIERSYSDSGTRTILITPKAVADIARAKINFNSDSTIYTFNLAQHKPQG
jgi:hypothetical protein